MCGICGFTGKRDDAEQILNNMMSKMVHRGPDDSGLHADGGINFGFRRLSIIGLDDGDQPLFNEDRSIVLVFNGEIYNYKEIKAELLEKGHDFRTHTDSEVLIHLYEEMGTAMLDRLRGMFAFAIWDGNAGQLFMARDFFGIKPLYYTQVDGSLVFGSEIKTILEYPGCRKEVNLEALECYLSYQYSALPETFFKGIFRLLPGHYMIFKDGTVECTRYWNAEFAARAVLDIDKAADEIDEIMQNSIKAHMVSDTEVGSFLSSGVDSSYVAACFHGDKTFTVGFDYENYNETLHAAELSQYINIKNYFKMISKEEYWASLRDVQYHADEPLADASCIGLYFVSQLASQHVKVVLSGEGADELFGGYTIYNEPYGLASITKLPMFVRRMLGFFAKLIPFRMKGKNFLIRGSKPVEKRFIGNAFILSEKERKRILRSPTAAPGPFEHTAQFYKDVADKDDTTKMQYVDIHTWLAGDILLKADKMSMAHSLELRVPFLDKEVFKIASGLPLNCRVDGQRTKIAMREAAGRYIPQDSSTRRKLGFPTPIRIWLREEGYYTKIHEAFSGMAAAKFFDNDKIIKLLDDHFNNKKDNSRKIWTIYMFLVWYDVFFG